MWSSICYVHRSTLPDRNVQVPRSEAEEAPHVLQTFVCRTAHSPCPTHVAETVPRKLKPRWSRTPKIIPTTGPFVAVLATVSPPGAERTATRHFHDLPYPTTPEPEQRSDRFIQGHTRSWNRCELAWRLIDASRKCYIAMDGIMIELSILFGTAGHLPHSAKKALQRVLFIAIVVTVPFSQSAGTTGLTEWSHLHLTAVVCATMG